ncbi:protein of unknown function (plasmid) [Cupriavidus taiwanensis]|uniref:Uncharacterized protein n=1 Tax=Cupriavidus taiwanensis TaxID=164546 RepID=A0A7Z7JE45_9BURK|nr:protein of unknown function [Cupriavidus taiwanensis]SOZ11302.1 protein of unknown function [Cupriavidus taiwanensis]SOZ42654.1 protein of unknown function [Cupriavidus taiwanensis]SPC21750.1 protein of unknown function [Cupriavidus taiwanensis]SPD55804.1 protein of unknown function [Cupriavidus taiwanensis]
MVAGLAKKRGRDHAWRICRRREGLYRAQSRHNLFQPNNHTVSVAKLPQSSYIRFAPLCRRTHPPPALVPMMARHPRQPAWHGDAHHR